MVSLGMPLLGELVATSPPPYSRRAALSALGLGIPFEDVSFPAAGDVLLRGWFFPADKPDAPAILYAPSTASDQRSGLSLVGPFHEAGYSFLLFSYRGHGSSEGNPFGFTYGARESEDVDAAIRFLTEDKGIHHVGAIGHSAGAVSIILSAARNADIQAVIAASPFPSLEEVWKSNRPPFVPIPLLELAFQLSELTRGYSRQQIRPLDVINLISPRPLLLIQGGQDGRISYEQSRRLFNAAQEPKQMWVAQGANHAQVRSPVLDAVVDEMISFFDHALRGGVSAPIRAPVMEGHRPQGHS
jgi:dipeptidyl aminopeptidase/acylaminoacyl peptidase